MVIVHNTQCYSARQRAKRSVQAYWWKNLKEKKAGFFLCNNSLKFSHWLVTLKDK